MPIVASDLLKTQPKVYEYTFLENFFTKYGNLLVPSRVIMAVDDVRNNDRSITLRQV
jgi:hypothetical protein